MQANMPMDNPAQRSEEPTSNKQVLSPWIPVSLLAVTTAALAVPLVLLRRQRRAATSLSHAVERAAPPPRRNGRFAATITASTPTPANGPPPPRRPSRALVTPSPMITSPSLNHSEALASNVPSAASKVEEDGDAFNAPLYTLKAFGLATLCVALGGATGVWGVKTYLGVNDAQEFGALMRAFTFSKMPFLSSRIHRPPSSEARLAPAFSHSASVPSESQGRGLETPGVVPVSVSEEALERWTWAEAQERLSAAYERGGVGLWAEVALREMEVEAELLRRRRTMEGAGYGKGIS